MTDKPGSYAHGSIRQLLPIATKELLNKTLESEQRLADGPESRWIIMECLKEINSLHSKLQQADTDYKNFEQKVYKWSDEALKLRYIHRTSKRDRDEEVRLYKEAMKEQTQEYIDSLADLKSANTAMREVLLAERKEAQTWDGAGSVKPDNSGG